VNKLKLLLATLTIAVIAACSGPGGTAPNPEDTGTIGAAITLSPGVNLNVIQWTIGVGGAATYSGNVAVGSVTAASFQAGGIADGAGYYLELSAMTTGNVWPCSGSAGPFTISTGVTTMVSATLTCGTDAGIVGANQQDSGSVAAQIAVVVDGGNTVCSAITLTGATQVSPGSSLPITENEQGSAALTCSVLSGPGTITGCQGNLALPCTTGTQGITVVQVSVSAGTGDPCAGYPNQTATISIDCE
jgi:hypothetical protein